MPTSSDVACVGVGQTVKVTEGANQTGVLQGEGALVMSGGSLELSNALEVSSIAALTLEKATLMGAGTLNVSSSLSWEAEGTMAGSGKTVLKPGSTATVLPKAAVCEGVHLTERTLVNEGTLTFSGTYSTGGSFAMSEGARLENKGTFNDNSEAWYCSPWEYTIVESAGSKVAPLIVNTGTFARTESSNPTFTTKVAVPFENWGYISTPAGNIQFLRGISTEPSSQYGGPGNPSAPGQPQASCGDPVNEVVP